MEYKEHILQFSSFELYQKKFDEGNSYIPYVIAKVKIEGIWQAIKQKQLKSN
jgi:hypothetical protein